MTGTNQAQHRASGSYICPRPLDSDDGSSDNDTLSSFDDDSSDNDSETNPPSLSEKELSPMSAQNMAGLQDAVLTMQVCRELFQSWDKVLRQSDGKSSSVPTSAIRELQDTVKKLLRQSSDALAAATKLLDSHYRYSRALYRSLGESSSTGKFAVTHDMEKQVQKIQEKARLYTDTVALMKDTLQGLTDQLDRAVKQAQKKDSWRKRLMRWIKKLLGVLPALFAAGAALAAGLGPLVSGGLGAGSILGKALSAMIPKDGTAVTEDNSDKLLQFLKYTLKNEVSDACNRLAELDNCYPLVTEVMYESREQTFLIEKATAKEMKPKWRKQCRKLHEFRERIPSGRESMAT